MERLRFDPATSAADPPREVSIPALKKQNSPQHAKLVVKNDYKVVIYQLGRTRATYNIDPAKFLRKSSQRGYREDGVLTVVRFERLKRLFKALKKTNFSLRKVTSEPRPIERFQAQTNDRIQVNGHKTIAQSMMGGWPVEYVTCPGQPH